MTNTSLKSNRTDCILIKSTRGISLIVGGHSHSLLDNVQNDTRVMGPYPTKVTNLGNLTTYVVQAYRFGQYMGQVDLEFDDNDELIALSGEPILLDNTIPKHEATQSTVMEWRSAFDYQTKHIIGFATADLPFLVCKFSRAPISH